MAVVLNWNAWSDAIACVESLLQSNKVPDQIVICDNGSVDGSMDLIAGWAARARIPHERFSTPQEALASFPSASPLILISIGENRGYAGGNNVGIRYAVAHSDADYVWILNSDVVVEADALGRMVELADGDDSIGIVGAKLLRFDAPDTIQALGGGYILPVFCHDTQLGSGCKAETAGTEPIALDHVVGASLLVRSQAIREVGLIDESYFLYREETDWCIRMRQAGWNLMCCTQASIWHKQSHSIGFKSPLHDYYAVRNMLHLVRKFYPASLPAAFSYFAFRSLVPKVLRGEFARLSAVLSAYRDFVFGVSGRAKAHSEPILMSNYGIDPDKPVVVPEHEERKPVLRQAIASIVFGAFLVLATAINGSAFAQGDAGAQHRQRDVVVAHYRLTPSTAETE